MFCSTSITLHLLRGAGAFVLLLTAVSATGFPALLRMAAVGGAFLLMRGCPMCWLIGLQQTLARQANRSHQPLSKADS
jgi:hypothetical protein